MVSLVDEDDDMDFREWATPSGKRGSGGGGTWGEEGELSEMQIRKRNLEDSSLDEGSTRVRKRMLSVTTETSLSSPSSAFSEHLGDMFSLPANYKYLKVLGQGRFGKVIGCHKQDTGEHVAVKFACKKNISVQNEVSMLRRLMQHKMDEFNIVRFIDNFNVGATMGLVFEKLDMSLYELICKGSGWLKLQEIRTILQQLAVALDALKNLGFIHGDLKLDNIMLVDHSSQPFRVKLIDFGLAMFRSEAKEKLLCQPPAYSAPEVIFGLPLSEAIDIWSLGTLMAEMLFYCILFPGKNNYEVLRHMIAILGPPPDYLLNASKHPKDYFIKQNPQWLFESDAIWSVENQLKEHKVRSLDEMKMEFREPDNKTEATERSECIELLKAMLQWDPTNRITPCGILEHPFITKSFLYNSSHSKHQDQKQNTSLITGGKLYKCNTPEPCTSQDQPRLKAGMH